MKGTDGNGYILKMGGKCLTGDGRYFLIYIGNRKMQLEHRYVVEQILGRKLRSSEVIHHINGIGTDNRIDNLELFESNKSHMKIGHAQPKTVCLYCKKIFVARGYHSGTAKYCGKVCFAKARLQARTICPVCGLPASRPSRKYCSRKCCRIDKKKEERR